MPGGGSHNDSGTRLHANFLRISCDALYVLHDMCIPAHQLKHSHHEQKSHAVVPWTHMPCCAPEGFKGIRYCAIKDGDGGHAHVVQRLRHCEPRLIRPPLCYHNAELDPLRMQTLNCCTRPCVRTMLDIPSLCTSFLRYCSDNGITSYTMQAPQLHSNSLAQRLASAKCMSYKGN